MKKKLLAVITTLVMTVSGVSGALMYAPAAAAASEDPYEVEKLEGAVDTEQNNYMTDSQYKKLFGKDLSTVEVEEFDPDNTYNPLDGYQPTVLNELFLGYMNRNNNYDGQFAVMENASSDEGFNIDAMWNTNYGGINTYYGEDQDEDIYTHAINTIALTPGKLTDEGASTKEQILIENRIYLEEDGALHEDDTHAMISIYALSEDGTKWQRYQCAEFCLADSHWAWNIDVAEQQSYTAMAVGDYDSDNYNEVAVYIPSSNASGEMAHVNIYQPVENDNVYGLDLEYSFRIDDISSHFDVWMDKYHSYVHLNTTKIAGRDDLVVSATQAFLTEDEFGGNSALAVWSFQNNSKKIEFNSELEYDGYRFKMPATANADLNGDGIDELVVGGFKNTNYAKDGASRGSISETENLVNVLLYEDGKYQLAWNKPQATGAIDLDHAREMDAPVAMAAGKYRSGSVTDTVFLEGTYLDFTAGSGKTANDQIRNGRFNHDPSENIQGDFSDSTINIGASGSFVSDKTAMEQVVFYVVEASNSAHNKVNVDIIWGHPTGTGAISTDIVKNNYIENTEEDDGTIVTMCPLNVDDDTALMKYTGKSVGWSNPVVYGVLMSMPYWQEMDYGDLWNARGQTDFGVTKTTEDSTEVTVGVDVENEMTISGEATVLGNGVGLGVDFGKLASYANSTTDTTSLAKSITWSSGGGVDATALMVMPIVTYKYKIIVPEHEATEEEKKNGKEGTVPEYSTMITCTGAYDPVYTDVSVDTYNDVVEDFNVMAETAGKAEDKLPLIDLNKIYAGAKLGDPSSYASSPNNISSVEGDDYLYAGEVYAQTGKDKAVETLSIETSESTTESNGFSLGLKAGYMGEISVGADFMSIVSVTGKIGMGVTGQIASGGTWATTTATGITYSGAFANLPGDAEGYGYEYSAGLAKWNASLEGLDEDLTFKDSDEVLEDNTVIIAPTVLMDGMVPPALPLDIHVLGVTDDTAVLEWTNPVGERAPDSYKIYYSMEADGIYRPLDVTVDGDQTKKVITGLSSGSTYYFKLEALDAQTSLRSVLSAPVEATTKIDGEPVITKHPQDCNAKVGESALFEVSAKPYTEGNTLSYQWQKLLVGDYGISWKDINEASDSSIGREVSFNAAYASEDGKIRQQDIDDLNGNVYRCIVSEKEAGKLDYVETVSNSATLYAGEENLLGEAVLTVTASDGTTDYDAEVIAAAGDKVTVAAALTKKDGTAISGTTIHFALMDKEQEHSCVKHLYAVTDASGKASVEFAELKEGSYEIIAAAAKKENSHRAAVSNSIDLTVNQVFEIVYELNGGINHNLNPLSYAAGSKCILLRDASREGYEFIGWHLDKELKEKITTKWLLLNDVEGTLYLYAGWKEIEDDAVDPDDPAGPGKPEDDGSKPGEDAGGSDDGTDTGDETPLAAAAAVMLAALGGAAAVLFGRRRTE